jgi:hypothetical protein
VADQTKTTLADPFTTFHDSIRRAEEAAKNPPTATPPAGTGGWLGYGDPVEQGVNWVAERLPESAFPKGGWARWAGSKVIPQNAPEAALMALTLPLGGPVFSTGAKIGAKVGAPLASEILRRAGTQAVKSGTTAGLVAGATGHNPYLHGALGAVGGGAGQTIGDVGGATLQALGVPRLLRTAGEKMKDWTAGAFKAIPTAATAKEAWTNILTGRNAAALEKQIVDLGQKYQTNPTRWPGLGDPELGLYLPTVIARAAQAGQSALDPATSIPKMQAVWQYGTPEARQWLIKKGYMLTGAGEAGKYADLNKQLKGAQLVQQWLTGEADPAKITPELVDDAIQKYFTKDMQLTAEGLTELGRRFSVMRPGLEQRLGKAATQDLEKTLLHDAGQGLQRGVSGELPKVDLRWKPPFVEVTRQGVLPSVPGWEQAAQAGATLGERAIQALTPPVAGTLAQLPAKLGERPAPPAPAAPPPAPTFGTPPPADRPAERGAPVVEPPPPRPAPPAGWFPPAEATPAPGGGSETPWFNQPLAPPPTLTGEPAKPGLHLEIDKAKEE